MVSPDPQALATSESQLGLWITHFSASPFLQMFLTLSNQLWPGSPFLVRKPVATITTEAAVLSQGGIVLSSR